MPTTEMAEIANVLHGALVLIAGVTLALVGYIGRRMIGQIDTLTEKIDTLNGRLSYLEGLRDGSSIGSGRGPWGAFPGRAGDQS
jgi:hypothetical protein